MTSIRAWFCQMYTSTTEFRARLSSPREWWTTSPVMVAGSITFMRLRYRRVVCQAAIWRAHSAGNCGAGQAISAHGSQTNPAVQVAKSCSRSLSRRPMATNAWSPPTSSRRSTGNTPTFRR